MIKETFVILMILTHDGSVASVNHATADKSLNAFDSQRDCEKALPEFVLETYPEFSPKPNLLDHHVVINGQADSPVGKREATWRCTVIFSN
jgi:hypothetical protein